MNNKEGGDLEGKGLVKAAFPQACPTGRPGLSLAAKTSSSSSRTLKNGALRFSRKGSLVWLLFMQGGNTPSMCKRREPPFVSLPIPNFQ